MSQGPKVDLQFEEDALGLTSKLSSEHFIALADLCNRRLQGTCRWIFSDREYKRWLLGAFKTLYCVGPRKFIAHEDVSSTNWIHISWRGKDISIVR